ncbi:MAG: dihydroorotase [Candidatus Heimdallarchaeaceae archaeon]
MVRLTNLKVWDEEKRDFVIEDVDVTPSSDSTEKIKENQIDCENYVAIPLGVDLHVHFREPGYIHKEDLHSGSIAAFHGGITTVLDMPNTIPVTDSVETVIQKRELAKKRAIIDVKIAVAITDTNVDKVIEIAKHCDAFKVFMAESFGNLSVKYENIEKALKMLSNIENPPPIIFHAEDKQILEQNSNKKTHLERHPAEAEATAIQKVIGWAIDHPELHFHITHVSSALSIKLLKLVSSPNLTSDTCMRYLLLDNESKLSEAYKKVNPPLRTPMDRKELVDAFTIGIIDMISSDHSPHTRKEKEEQKLSGMPGVQEILPGLITLIHTKQLEWERAIEAYHTLPSKLLNIENNRVKNSNFLIVDTQNPFELKEEWIKSKVGWSPFEGWKFYGKIKYIVQNNKMVKLN